MSKINLQLYSVREMLNKDFAGTMDKIAQMGFTGVEFAGYYGYTVRGMKEELEKRGLTAVSTHVGFDLLKENLKGQIDYIKSLGAKYLVCPCAHFENYDEVMKTAEIFNEWGKICSEEGVDFYYHNHAHEFVEIDGKPILDILFENTDPKFVKPQLDVYWVKKGGKDPYEYVAKYADRSDLVHLKQYGPSGEDSDADDGIIDFRKIIELSKGATGIYEQEKITVNDMGRIEKSCKYLIKELL